MKPVWNLYDLIAIVRDGRHEGGAFYAERDATAENWRDAVSLTDEPLVRAKLLARAAMMTS